VLGWQVRFQVSAQQPHGPDIDSEPDAESGHRAMTHPDEVNNLIVLFSSLQHM